MVMAKTGNKNLDYLKRDSELVNPVLHRIHPIVADHAKGSYIYDMNGDAYLDFTTGIAVNNVGHCHPKVVEAVQKQAAQLMHTSIVTHHKGYADVAAKLIEIAPGRLDSVFLANSGAEAVEGALKMARYITGRPAIINFRGSFHGRTFMTTALTTSKLYYREKYEPFPSSIFTLPYPYVYRSSFRNDPEACVDDCIKQFDVLFNQFVHPDQVAAILVEPVQGEGGYIVPPDSFLKRLRQVADRAAWYHIWWQPGLLRLRARHHRRAAGGEAAGAGGQAGGAGAGAAAQVRRRQKARGRGAGAGPHDRHRVQRQGRQSEQGDRRAGGRAGLREQAPSSHLRQPRAGDPLDPAAQHVGCRVREGHRDP